MLRAPAPFHRLALAGWLAAAAGCGDRPPVVPRPPPGDAMAPVEIGPAQDARSATEDLAPAPATDAGPLDDQPGAVPLRLFTLFEYNNTVRDLLGVTTPLARPGTRSTDHGTDSGFVVGAPIVASHDVRDLMALARSAVATVGARIAERLPAGCTLMPPTPAAEEACLHGFLRDFGLRAFRRPVTEAERADLVQLFEAGRARDAGGTFADGLRVLCEGMLQSPFFLYRWEVGPTLEKDGSLARLSPYEIAARLSYFFTASMPDDELFRAAGDGELARPEQIEAQARRLLASPRAAAAIADFHRQWLAIDRLDEAVKTVPAAGPGARVRFGPALTAAMQSEIDRFVARHYLDALPHGFRALFTDTHTLVEGDLAELYGRPSFGGGAQALVLDPAERAGLLTRAAVLAAHAGADDPGVVQRGLLVAQSILCLEQPAPPSDVPSDIPVPPPNATTRRRFEVVLSGGCARACHAIYDLGFAFGNYDQVGAFGREERGQPIDARGSITLPSGVLSYANAVELSQRLPQVPEAQSCLVRQWLRYLLRRRDQPGDAASLRAASLAFSGARFELRALLIGLTRTRAFTHRTPAAEEAP